MKRLIPLAVLALVGWLGSMGRATASMPIQKQAKAAGAQAANCLVCHVDKLPKKDAHALNDKGKWLVTEKEKRKAKAVDGAWLKDYKEEKK